MGWYILRYSIVSWELFLSQKIAVRLIWNGMELMGIKFSQILVDIEAGFRYMGKQLQLSFSLYCTIAREFHYIYLVIYVRVVLISYKIFATRLWTAFANTDCFYILVEITGLLVELLFCFCRIQTT